MKPKLITSLAQERFRQFIHLIKWILKPSNINCIFAYCFAQLGVSVARQFAVVMKLASVRIVISTTPPTAHPSTLPFMCIRCSAE